MMCDTPRTVLVLEGTSRQMVDYVENIMVRSNYDVYGDGVWGIYTLGGVEHLLYKIYK